MGRWGGGGWTYPPEKPKKPKPWDGPNWPAKHPDRYVPHEPPPENNLLAHIYGELRHHGDELESLLGALDIDPRGFTEEDRKRLDKAVVVMKVGFKIVKRVLRNHGFRGRLKTDAPAQVAARQALSKDQQP